MKTYTEIEKLADEVYPHTDMGKLKSHIGFINGYNKCQEDMADRKYTEEDIRNILENYFSHITCHISQYCDKEDLQQPYEWLDINLHSLSLNKQD